MAESDKDLIGDLFLSTGMVLFLGRHVSTAPHRHFTAAITISLEGPIRYRASEAEPWIETQGFAARSNAALECDTGDELVINMQLDPEKSDVRALNVLDFGGREVMSLPDAMMTPLVEKLRRIHATPDMKGMDLQQAVLSAIHDQPVRPRLFDPRVARVLQRLKDAVPEALSSAELARGVGLSEGRLIHLFAEQLGVPLRRYVLALRLRRTLFFLSRGHTLTDAAQEAGFSDSAHLTRVYREMYGLPPSKMFRSPSVRIRVEREPTLTGPYAQHDREVLASFNNQPDRDARRSRDDREARRSRDASGVISSASMQPGAPSALARSR